MIRITLFALMGVVFLSTFTPSAALAQDDDCLFYYNKVDEETGETIRICSQNARQTTVATAAVGVVNPARGVTSSVSPNRTSATVSPAVDTYPYGHGGVPGGYYPPPHDPRLPFALSEAYKAGVTVTTFERELEGAVDRGIRDGQHEAVMSRLDEIEAGYRAELVRFRTRLEAAVSLGNKELEAAFRARITDVERKLEEAKAPSGGSGSTPTPGEKTTPTPATDGGSGVREYFDRRLPQSRKR